MWNVGELAPDQAMGGAENRTGGSSVRGGVSGGWNGDVILNYNQDESNYHGAPTSGRSSGPNTSRKGPQGTGPGTGTQQSQDRIIHANKWAGTGTQPIHPDFLLKADAADLDQLKKRVVEMSASVVTHSDLKNMLSLDDGSRGALDPNASKLRAVVEMVLARHSHDNDKSKSEQEEKILFAARMYCDIHLKRHGEELERKMAEASDGTEEVMMSMTKKMDRDLQDMKAQMKTTETKIRMRLAAKSTRKDGIDGDTEEKLHKMEEKWNETNDTNVAAIATIGQHIAQLRKGLDGRPDYVELERMLKLLEETVKKYVCTARCR